MAADIRAAVDHAEHLISALLILARNERGLTVREQVDLATAAEDILDAAGVATGGCTPRWSPRSSPATRCWPNASSRTWSTTRPGQRHPAGEMWIGTRSIADSSQLTMANTGPVDQPRRRRPHLPAVPAAHDRTSHDGSGLGLAIVASIAAIHGGTAAPAPAPTAACPSRSPSPRSDHRA